MAFDIEHLPDPIAKRLRSFYRRKRLYGFLRVLLGTAFVMGVLALIVMHIDRFAFLSISARSGLVYGAWVIGGVYAAVALVRFLLYAPTPREIAYEMEEKLPDDVEERYVSLEDVLRPGKGSLKDTTNPELLNKLRDSTIAHSKGVKAGQLVTDKKARRLFRACLVLAFGYALLFLPSSYEFDLMVKRFLHPGESMPKASFVKLDVSPKNVVLGKGGNLVIQAEKGGSLPAPMEWIMEMAGADPDGCYIAQTEGTETPFRYSRATVSKMSRVHRTLFLYSATGLQKGFSYRVRCGDAQTDVRKVRVVRQPEVVGLKVRIDPPEKYENLEPEVATDVEGRIKALRGSEVTVEFGTDRPVEKRLIQVEGKNEPVTPEMKEGERRAQYSFTLEKKTQFNIKVVDKMGFANVNRPEVTIVPVKDQKPIVQLNYPSGEVRKVPAEIVPTQATIRDDIGVQEVFLSYTLNPDRSPSAKPRTVDVSLDKTPIRELDASPVLDLGDVGAVPGDVVVVRLVAKDVGGNYGESRSVSVQIVPFTRGTNEHKRIVALQFLTDALKQISEKGKLKKGFDVDKEIYSSLLKKAQRMGLELKERASINSLLGLLEREQYFTGIPHYKKDVRRIYAALYSVCALSETGQITDRREKFHQLAHNVLTPLVNYRRAKNLTWRLFGMKYEAVSISNRLGTLAKQENPPGRAQKAIKRRAELYLSTLQDMGSELIGMSRRLESLEKENVETVIGELVTAGYYMKRGSLQARSDSCQKVKARIPQLIEITRTLLPDLQQQEVMGRETLAEVFRSSVKSLKPGQMARWLSMGASMMQWNPFAPVWPQYLRYAAKKRVGRGKTSSKKLVKAITSAPGAQSGPVRWEKRNMARMAYHLRMKSILSERELSPLEKGLVLRTMRLEWASRFPEKSDTSVRQERQAIVNLTEGSAPSGRQLEELGRIFDPPRKARVGQVKKLREEAKGLYQLETPGQMVENLLGAMKGVKATISNTSSVLESGESANIQKRLRGLLDELADEKRKMNAIPRGIWLRLALFAPSAESAHAMEQAFLWIRYYQRQYNGRIGRSMETIRGFIGGDQDSDVQRARLGTEIQKVRAIHNATVNKFKKLTSLGQDGTGSDKKDTKKTDQIFTLMDVFKRTREYVQTSRRLTGGGSPEKLAEQFVQKFPQAGIAYLRENTQLVRAASEAMKTAQKIVEENPGDVERFKEVLNRARERIGTFETMVKRSTTKKVRSQIEGPLSELRIRLNKIAPRSDQEIGGKAEFKLAEARRVARKFLGQLGLITKKVSDKTVKFVGGPDGVFRRGQKNPYWRDVERTQSRLARWSQSSRGIIMEGVLEALGESPEPRAYTAAWNWSRFLYRLVRSELARGEKERIGGQQRKKKDPRKEFLQAELQDALRSAEMKYYERTAKEYLDLAKDFLEY